MSSATHPVSPILLSPLKIGDLELSNRVVLAPLTRGRTGLNKHNKVPTPINAEYYEQRASAGLIISEATAISDQGFGWYGAPGLYDASHVAGWKGVTDAVHKKNGKIFLQLWHMGRQSHPTLHSGPQETVSASAIGISGTTRNSSWESVPYAVPRALETNEIPLIVADYAKSAQLAKDAGFDGVEIHGANGYLIDQFTQASSNKRTDQYGGSVDNRLRFLFEVVDAVVKVFPSNRVGIRLSPNGAFGGMGSADNDVVFIEIAKRLKSYGLAYIHLMDGLGFGFHNLCRPVTLFDIKSAFGGVVIGNIGYTQESAEGALRSGAADLIAFGRSFISNPDLVERFQHGYPLAPQPAYETWYGNNTDKDGSTGKFYTDFPPYQKPEEKAAAAAAEK